ncbi:MAG: DUF177 domain-containing protein [Bacteroidales bacterium]|nr:DUF177 domain-containing protein [Bacteroidales bacterium]
MTKAGFTIPFKGLSLGNHSFDFEVGQAFFESFAYFEGISGSLKAHVDLLKESRLMNLDFQIEGNINLPCDRCLERFDQPVTGRFRLIVRFGDTFVEESDEVIVLPFSESNIALDQYLFEYISILLPLQNIHPDDENGESGCNITMTGQLNQYAKQKEDPRWEVLKKLKRK